MKYVKLTPQEKIDCLNRFSSSLEKLLEDSKGLTPEESFGLLTEAYKALFLEHEATKIFYEKDVENLKRQIK